MIFVTNDHQMGKNIRCLREKLNLSQEAFSRLVGMECASLDAIEQGILLEIDAQTLIKICEQFRVDAKSLIEDCFA